jgi:hypothetical protein
VSDLRMGSSRVDHEHVVIQTLFELTAFVAPPDVKAATNVVPSVATAQK